MLPIRQGYRPAGRYIADDNQHGVFRDALIFDSGTQRCDRCQDDLAVILIQKKNQLQVGYGQAAAEMVHDICNPLVVAIGAFVGAFAGVSLFGLVGLLLGLSAITVPWATLVLSVLYLGVFKSQLLSISARNAANAASMPAAAQDEDGDG